jgi:hypothetical protein
MTQGYSFLNMATGKKSFVLYTEYESVFDMLSDEDAGKLIKHIFHYCNDKNLETDNNLIKFAFEPIKQHLNQDFKKLENIIAKKVEGGRKGGLKSGEVRRSRMEQKEDANETDNTIPHSDEVFKNNINQFLAPQMLQIWKRKRPNYYSIKEVDYPALSQIAKQIADYKKINYQDITGEKKEDILRAWQKVVDFIMADEIFFSKKDISFFIIKKNWLSLVNKMQES